MSRVRISVLSRPQFVMLSNPSHYHIKTNHSESTHGMCRPNFSCTKPFTSTWVFCRSYQSKLSLLSLSLEQAFEITGRKIHWTLFFIKVSQFKEHLIRWPHSAERHDWLITSIDYEPKRTPQTIDILVSTSQTLFFDSVIWWPWGDINCDYHQFNVQLDRQVFHGSPSSICWDTWLTPYSSNRKNKTPKCNCCDAEIWATFMQQCSVHCVCILFYQLSLALLLAYLLCLHTCLHI